MLQAKLDEISRRIYPFKKFEYVYSDGQVKSVIIDIEDFLSLMETFKIESNPDLMQSIKNGLKDFREEEFLKEEEISIEFAKSIKGKYKNCNTNSKLFAIMKRQEIKLEERKFKRE